MAPKFSPSFPLSLAFLSLSITINKNCHVAESRDNAARYLLVRFAAATKKKEREREPGTYSCDILAAFS